MISEIITAALFLVNYHYVESGTNPFTIFGGNDTNIQTYKFLVDVQWHGTHCGGCIISHALVMTVAHCVHGVNRGYIHVHIGSSSPVPGPAGLSIGISEILEHPDYNYATDANDISLLRLRRNLTYGDNIGAVHLPRENEMLLRPDTVIRAIGFGVMRNGSYTQLLTEGYLWIVKYIRCEDAYGITFVSQICAKNEDITLGEVKHSQRANLKPLDVWCIIVTDGSISTAHCTCMAGNSEVCSHVGAILFAAEYSHTKKEAMSCTDVRAMWPMPSMSVQVPIVPVREMNWGKASVYTENEEVPPISASELVGMLENVLELGHSSAIMRIDKNVASSVLDIFDQNNMSKNYSEQMELTKTFDFTMNEEEIFGIEKATRNQTENKNWFVQRAGRITASRFKAVCRSNKSRPSLSLIKSIFYPTKILFNTKAISWGISHEHIAVEEYQKHMEKNYKFFVVNEVGLIVGRKCSQLGASPDRLVYCAWGMS